MKFSELVKIVNLHKKHNNTEYDVDFGEKFREQESEEREVKRLKKLLQDAQNSV